MGSDRQGPDQASSSSHEIMEDSSIMDHLEAIILVIHNESWGRRSLYDFLLYKVHHKYHTNLSFACKRIWLQVMKEPKSFLMQVMDEVLQRSVPL